MAPADLPEGTPVRRLLGEVPVVAVRAGGTVHVLADRCSHMSGPLSDSELTDGCLTCPWHGSVFRVADGAVVRGPATAPQPAFEVREADGVIQVCLPDAGLAGLMTRRRPVTDVTYASVGAAHADARWDRRAL